MSRDEFSRGEIEARLPSILAGRNSIALIPFTTDEEWAGEVAWEIARAASKAYRRVTLIDLNLNNPAGVSVDNVMN